MCCDVVHRMAHEYPSLRQLREDAGLTQKTLGHQAGVTQHCISQLETGYRRGRVCTLKKLADVLGVTVTELRMAEVQAELTQLQRHREPTEPTAVAS